MLEIELTLKTNVVGSSTTLTDKIKGISHANNLLTFHAIGGDISYNIANEDIADIENFIKSLEPMKSSAVVLHLGIEKEAIQYDTPTMDISVYQDNELVKGLTITYVG